MKKSNLFVCGFLILTLTSCGKETDVDRLGDAQACLDKQDGSNPTAVDKCLEPVESISSRAAEGLRCTAGFLKEDLATGYRIVEGFDRLGSSPSSDKTLEMMEILTFTSAGALADDLENSETTYNSCLLSQGKGSTLLASFSYFAMALVNYMDSAVGCGGSPISSGGAYDFTYYDLRSCMDITTLNPMLPADLAKIVALVELVNPSTVDAVATETQSGIGAVLVGVAQVSCPEGAPANQELCALVNDAITAAGGTSDPRAVAIQFFTEALGFPTSP